MKRIGTLLATTLMILAAHAQTDRTEAEVRKRAAAHPELILTSSEKGMGIPDLRAAVIEATG